MLTEPAGRWSSDSPWARLPWTLPTALLISAAVLWVLAYFMERPAGEQVTSVPVDARFIEEPVPQAPPIVARPAPAAPLPKPLRTPKPPPKNESVAQKAEPKQEAKPSPNIALPAAPDEEQAKSGIGEAGTVSGPASSGAAGSPGPALGGGGAQAGSGGGKGTSGGSMYESTGARAIVRPMPQIPDDLREEAFNVTALARFHVAADGSAEVELVRPTPDPRLNRLLLDSLKKWRFMPAIKNGKPVATTEEIVVKIEVK